MNQRYPQSRHTPHGGSEKPTQRKVPRVQKGAEGGLAAWAVALLPYCLCLFVTSAYSKKFSSSALRGAKGCIFETSLDTRPASGVPLTPVQPEGYHCLRGSRVLSWAHPCIAARRSPHAARVVHGPRQIDVLTERRRGVVISGSGRTGRSARRRPGACDGRGRARAGSTWCRTRPRSRHPRLARVGVGGWVGVRVGVGVGIGVGVGVGVGLGSEVRVWVGVRSPPSPSVST